MCGVYDIFVARKKQTNLQTNKYQLERNAWLFLERLRAVCIIAAQLYYTETRCVHLSAQYCGNLPKAPSY